jgi:CDP-diacylglycerol---serine O-phosphatidyltransferase
MFRPRVGRLKGQSFNRMIPNILTMLALCAGLTAFKFAFEARWEPAVLCILIAAVLDALDGRIARILKLSSRFGAELDSLSDFFAFGVAPPMMLYLWSLEQAGRVGWVVALIYAVCCALRLARFNTDIDAPSLPPWAKNYFTGVPSPAGAGLVLIPMILSFQIDTPVVRHPIVVSVFVVVVAFLMVSRLPTYSFKNVRIQHRYALVMMLIVALIAAFLVIAPWTLLTAILAAYIATMPFALRSFRRLQREAHEFQAQATLPLEPAPKPEG